MQAGNTNQTSQLPLHTPSAIFTPTSRGPTPGGATAPIRASGTWQHTFQAYERRKRQTPNADTSAPTPFPKTDTYPSHGGAKLHFLLYICHTTMLTNS